MWSATSTAAPTRCAAAADGADALVCLGDLLLFVDYADPAQGLFGETFGAENATRLVELRTAGRFDEARELSAGLWAGRRPSAARPRRGHDGGGPDPVRRGLRRDARRPRS